MKHTFKYSLMFIVLILAMMFSAIGATPALADEGTPPPPATEEVSQPPAEEPVMEQEPVVGEEPMVEQEAVAVEEPVVAPQEEVSVAEVLEQLPEDTTLVVLDENGETLPLVSEEAAKVLAAAADPQVAAGPMVAFSPTQYFTAGGTLYGFAAADCNPVTPGDQPCSNPFQTAMDYLANGGWTPDDNTIYVVAGSYDEDVAIDGSSWTDSIVPGNLILSGIGSGSTTLNGTLTVTNLNNAFTLQGFSVNDTVDVNIQGDIALNDVVVDGTDTGGGISLISYNRDITLQNVESHNSSGNGAYLGTQGDISVSDSNFQGNDGTGFYVEWGDNITLDGVTASGNGGNGIYTYSYSRPGSHVSVSDSTAQDNAGAGLYLATDGATLTLDGVTASGNGDQGANISAGGDVSVSDSTFQNNVETGLDTDNYGGITLNRVNASGNGWIGADLWPTGDVAITDSTFQDNEGAGLDVLSDEGNITLSGVISSGNGEAGAVLATSSNEGTVTITCSDFSDNSLGIDASTHDLTLNGVTFSGNLDGDYSNEIIRNNKVEAVQSEPGNIWINEHECNPEPPAEEPETPVVTPAEDGSRKGQVDELPILIKEQLNVEMPAALEAGNTFVSSLKVLLPVGGQLPADFMATLVFPVPANKKDARLAVQFWNGEEWVAGPGGSVVKDPPGRQPGYYYVVTVTELGTYVLVSK